MATTDEPGGAPSHDTERDAIEQVLLGEGPPSDAAAGVTVTGDAQAIEEAEEHLDGDGDGAAQIPRFPHTEYGNAERMIWRYGEDVRYCQTWNQWLHWTGQQWELDETGALDRYAKATVRAIQEEADTAEEEGDVGYAAALAVWGRQSESASAMSNLLRVARSEPGIPIRPNDLDRDAMLFNCQNGTINLRTGDLWPARRAQLCSKISPVAYDPLATCPRWEQFLREIMGDDTETIEWLKKAVGYSLTGSVTEKCFMVLYGSGNNGKSKFMDTISHIVGDYGSTADFNTFLVRRSDGPRDDLADLHGARFVSSSESERGAKLAEAFIKNVTGGDKVKARHLHEKLFEFYPLFKLWLMTNHKPYIGGTDPGIWGRVRLVPFEVEIPPEKQDKELGAKLRAEAPGILRWAVEGCLRWQQEGLGESSAIARATMEYREEMDVLAAFLRECCHTDDPDAMATKDEVYKAFKAWAHEEGMKRPYQKRTLCDMLKERGYPSARAKKEPYRDKYVVHGLSVKMSAPL